MEKMSIEAVLNKKNSGPCMCTCLGPCLPESASSWEFGNAEQADCRQNTQFYRINSIQLENINIRKYSDSPYFTSVHKVW